MKNEGNAFLRKYLMKILLPEGESNPGLPRDRRGYSPLYYRGLALVAFHVKVAISQSKNVDNQKTLLFGFN